MFLYIRLRYISFKIISIRLHFRCTAEEGGEVWEDPRSKEDLNSFKKYEGDVGVFKSLSSS
jgi:hypothetical protein